MFFRYTVVTALGRRGLVGGATNDRSDRSRVLLTVRATDASSSSATKIDDFVQALRTTSPLNSAGARIDHLHELGTGLAVEDHQVHSGNVDKFRWRSGVEMFI